MTAEDMRRAITRIAHEIVERHRGVEALVFAGIHTRGLPLAQRLAQMIELFEGEHMPVYALDISLYRDDVSSRVRPLAKPSNFPGDIAGKKVVIVDDVLYTGRSIRAAMDALTDFGRPQQVSLAVLIDRGHRELPIRAAFVGKNVPPSSNEEVQVKLVEIDAKDEVILTRGEY